MTSKSSCIFRFAVAVMCLAALTPALCQTSQPSQSGIPKNVYIARFTSRDSISPEILASFRDLFEESFERLLARDGNYRVLNRETIEKILAETKYEAALTSVDQLNAAVKGRLKIANAEGVIFGEVTDDKDSGDIVIAAKLQSFDSVLYWNESVTMRPGHLHDHGDRKEAMAQLIRQIGAPSETTKPATPQHNSPDATVNASIKLFTGHSIQDKLRLCEEPSPNPGLVGDCGVLTWNGVQYNAVWGAWTLISQRDLPEQPGGVKGLGSITIERDGDRGLILRRSDASGITCLYRGVISEANVASGTHACDLQGETIVSGTWTLIPKP